MCIRDSINAEYGEPKSANMCMTTTPTNGGNADSAFDPIPDDDDYMAVFVEDTGLTWLLADSAPHQDTDSDYDAQRCTHKSSRSGARTPRSDLGSGEKPSRRFMCPQFNMTAEELQIRDRRHSAPACVTSKRGVRRIPNEKRRARSLSGDGWLLPSHVKGHRRDECMYAADFSP
eukprot:TRINITY_DN60023_c0_g1_i1.p1 TRINITY_DN60023_c0_g1~~TRINITY_DN60023_c0_g1_i1.p1  ORF type:complete len:174 (+),score=19.67 TRINITY_DN60023_c0_g1_i1:194-715(+)